VKIKGAPREVETAEDERESEDTPEKWFREEVGRRRGTRERREGEWSGVEWSGAEGMLVRRRQKPGELGNGSENLC
jgi:hypothetical protein